MTKARLVVLTLCLFLCLTIVQQGHAREEVIDQRQEQVNYGFWFERDVIRWQEFMPTLDNLTAIEIYVHKAGSPPGNLIAEIQTLSGLVLGQQSVSQSSVPSDGWLKIEFGQISITAGTKYRIYVYASQASPDPENRYFWMGHTDSQYNSSCITDVSTGWPNYDYAFRTFGIPGWGEAYNELFDDQSDVGLFRQFRDKIVAKTTMGWIYKYFLYKNSSEALSVLLRNPELMLELKDIVSANKDSIEEVLNGNEGIIYNSGEIVSFLESFAQKSPQQLKFLTRMVKRHMLKDQRRNRPFFGLKLE